MIPAPTNPSVARSAAEWNVVVTLAEQGFRDAVKLLRKSGSVKRTAYYNVLVMKVEDPLAFLADFSEALAANPGIRNFVSHIMPAQHTFDFTAAEDFEARSREVALAWSPKLASKSFHVRLHRRGLKGVLSTPREERFLDDALLSAPEPAGPINFADPDAVIQVETIDGRAGMSLWTREDIRRYPFLGAD